MTQLYDSNRSRLCLPVCLAFALALCLGAPAAAQTSIGTVGLSAGWATFGQAVPQGVAPVALQVGSFPTQTDVKTRWPDNSIRFAVVTVHATTAGIFPVTPAASSSGSFAPALPSASVALVIGGVTYTAALPPAASTDTWLSGPLAYEGRSIVAPISAANGQPHPFLRVIFDTRVYSDGGGRVDVSVENVLDIAGATAVTYDVAIAVNGVSRFTKAAVQHFYLTRWRKTFAIGPTTFAAVTPDMTPFNASRALPPYLSIVTNRVDTIPDPSRYEILGSGALDTDMSAHGGRDTLAPYPDWTARYLVHKDPAQRAFVLANGDLAGSWPVHVREAETSSNSGVGTGRFVSLNQRPTIWYDQRAQDAGVDFIKGTPLPIREYTPICAAPPATPEPGCQPVPAGQTRLIPDNAHVPSLAFVPYVLTGDRYYADELVFWADYAMMRTYNGDGIRGSLGILENNEVRGYGWALRNIADAAAYHPEAAVRSYLSEKVGANLQWLDDYANSQDPVANPLKFLWAGYRPEDGFVSLWEQTYLAWAIDRANRLGFSGGLAHRDAIASLNLKLFTSEPVWPRQTVVANPGTTLPDGTFVPAGTVLTWSMPYLIGYGTSPSPNVFTYNKTLADVWTQTNNLSLQRNFAGFYGPEARLNLMVGIESGLSGAQNAYDYLWPFIGVNNFWGTAAAPVPDLAERAGWAVSFYPSAGKTVPSISWANPSDIISGTPLGSAQLNATASVPGTFVYTPPAGTVLNAANGHALSVTFYPTDTGTNQQATASVLLNVLPAATVSWNAPAPITYNTPLSATQLNATADAQGTFSYSRPLGTVLPLGAILPAGNWTLWVTFTPANPAYAPIISSVPLTVLKQIPVITWPTPANIVTPAPLSTTQLNASAAIGGTNAAGTFVYRNASGAVIDLGTVLPAGPGQRLSVTFTPTDTANVATATAAVAITVVTPTAPATPTPIKIGNVIAGTFNDATGHSGQSHLVFAPNTTRWWLFTLSSDHDALGNRTVQAYVSSGADLATATWSAAAPSPNLGNANGATNSLLAGGRSLGVALLSIAGVDYVHLFASAAFDGQASSNGHIRAQLGAGSISWPTGWNNPGSPNTASQWQGPPGTGGTGAASHPSWGNSVGISSGGFIHHFSVTMDQEVDCGVGRSQNGDTTASWVNDFGSNVSPTGAAGTSPPWTTAVIDKSMVHECKALAFAPLASDVMLAVYSNGAVAQPNLTNLRYQESGASGTWTNISGSSGGGDDNVFAADATIDQNDWALVSISTTTIYAFRKNGAAVEGASYNAAANDWSAMSGSTAPPAFGPGQAFKAGGGLFGATDGTNVWLFVINTDTSNSILFTKFSGTSWTAWAPVPGTNTGAQTRGFITGYRTLSSNQIGLAWTQGTSTFDVMTTSLNTGGVAASSPVTVTLTAPSAGSIVAGSAVSVTATASSTAGAIAGVQFLLDGVNLAAEDTVSPYAVTWNTTTAANGTHFLTAVARDTTGATAPASTTVVTVSNDTTSPAVVMTAPSNGASVAGSVVVAANASDDIGVVGVQFLLDGSPLGAEVTTVPYAMNWNSATVASGVHTLVARARDAAGHLTMSSSVSVTIAANRLTPTITWTPPASVAYGTALGAAQFNATANVPGTFAYAPAIGTVLPTGSGQPLSATFTPTDAAGYTTAAVNRSITVTKATPLIAWPNPSDIVYGTTLSASQLNASASVPGTFAYSPAAATVLPVGVAQTLSVTFTPADAANYTTATATVTITVTQPNRAPILANPGNQNSTDVSGYAQRVLADVPAAYWRLGETAGTSAADSAGANPGTVVGGVTLGQLGALADGNAAPQFNGSNGYVRVPNSAALQLAGDLTIELWLNVSLAARQTLISKDYLHEFELTLETTGRLNLYQGNGTTYQGTLSPAGVIIANTWQHVVVTRTAATKTICFYVNGVLRGSGPYVTRPVPGTSAVSIGRTGAGGGAQYVNGRLDEVALYPVVLSAAQVAAHYALRTTVDAPTAVTLPLAASDPDGDVVTLSASGLPPGLTIDPATGLISGTLSAPSAGTHQVTVTASDGSLATNQTFTWTVTHVNRTPALTNPGPQTSAEAASVSLQLTAIDPDGDGMTYSATGLPAPLTINPISGMITGTLSFTSAGTYSVTATVSDGSLLSSVTFNWTVVNTNRAPILLSPGNQTNSDLTGYAPAVLADSPAGYWRLGETTGTTAADSAGTNPGAVVGGVTLGQAGALADGNGAPLFNGSNGYVRVGNTGALQLAGDLTIELWLNVSLATRQTLISKDYLHEFELTLETTGRLNLYQGNGSTYQGTLSAAGAITANTWQHVVVTRSAATKTIRFYVNGVAISSATYVTIPAASANAVSIGRSGSGVGGQYVNGRLDEVAVYPAVLSGAQVAAHYALRTSVGAPTVVALPLAASDPDGDALTYGAGGLPPGLTIDPATGLISGTLSAASAGAYQVTATVSDGTFTASQTFTWTVTHVNRSPALTTPGTQTNTEGTSVSVQLVASDPDSDLLTYSATGLPASLTVDPATGLIAGPLSFSGAGSYVVTATASDGALSSSVTFSWVVANTNRAPVLANPGNQTNSDVSGYAPAVLADSPAAYWRLGETTGTTVADAAGTNAGTAVGGIMLGQSGALADGNAAPLFNGSNGYVRVANSAALQLAGDLTIELWLNVSLATRQTLISKDYLHEFELTLETPGRLNLYQGNGTTYQGTLSAVGTIVANTWQHVVVTRTAATKTIRFYVNGVAAGSGTYVTAPVTGTNAVSIGRTGAGGGAQYVNGRLDEVTLYPSVLSAAQVAAHYALRTFLDTPTVVTLQLAASDPDGDALAYGASGLPAGLTIDARTGLISGTLSAASVGTHQVTATVSDGSLSAAQTFSWTVTSASFSLNNAVMSNQAAPTSGVGSTNSAFAPIASASNTPPTLVNPGTQTTATDYTATVRVDAPVQYLRLGEAANATAVDASGFGRAGTYRGAIVYGQPGAINDGTTAVALDGSIGTYIDAGPPVFSVGVGALSVETWIKTTNADGLRRHIADNKGGGSNLAGVNLAIQSGRIYGKVANGTAQLTVVGTRANLNDGAWHHVAAVLERYYDGVHDRLVIYVDGVVDGTGTLPAAGWNVTSTRNFEIARLLGTNGFSFIGAIDEWAVYDVALSASQVATHYAARTGRGTVVALQTVATDLDGDAVTFSASGLPPPLTINPVTGLISGTLLAGSAGTYTVTVTASDGVSSTVQTFTWTVTSGG